MSTTLLATGFALGHGSGPGLLQAQGVTRAAVQGTVSTPAGTPIEAAVVEVTNTVTGQRWRFETRETGRYFFENVAIGGPYLIEARAVGYGPARVTGVSLSLGQRYTADFTLDPAALELAPIVVAADALANAGRTGPAQRISDSTIARLPNPLPGRDPFNYALLSPQASTTLYGDLSIAGQNPVYTGYQIDGGSATSGYSTGPAGQSVLPFAISPEAIEEIEVLVAPFDVREGSFAGGLVSAVTKSGGNQWHGSAFGNWWNQWLVGRDSAGTPSAEFATWQYGGTLSGPIIRNRVHVFASADLQHLVTPDNGPFISDTVRGRDTVRFGVSADHVQRFRDILAGRYGLSPGTLGRVDSRSPARDLFAKVTVQPGANDQVELSYHNAHVHDDPTPGREYGGYALSSTVQPGDWTMDVGRLIWHTSGGRWANELMVSGMWIHNDMGARSPSSIVLVEEGGNSISAGISEASGVTPWLVRPSTIELSDNATAGFGHHLLTVGTHNQFHRIQDNTFLDSGGNWTFNSLDALERGKAFDYYRNIPGPLAPDGPDVDFRVRIVGLYAQDQWSATRRLTVTGGLRMDVPYLPDRAATNRAVLAGFGYDTGRLPSGHPLWSPRLGVNYDLRGDGITYLRGGIGLFSGSPSYRWIANAYRDNGGVQASLHCEGEDVPAFTPLAPPVSCAANATGELEPAITVFEPDFRFPQDLKLALGLDHRLPWDIVASMDLLLTRWIHQVYIDDLNLSPPVGIAAGEGGRLLYGTIDAAGEPTTARRDAGFGQVVRMSNRGGDQAISASVQLQRRFGAGTALTASYTYSRADDRVSLVNFMAGYALAHTPVDGSVKDRSLRGSVFDAPHRVVVGGSVDLPLGVRLGLLYSGESQSSYTYVVAGDVNADGIDAVGAGRGIGGNDIVYVPRDVRRGGDIALVVNDGSDNFVPAPDAVYAQLDRFIQEESCLRGQRGSLLRRGSCHNGWLGLLNARISKTVPLRGAHALELATDIYNALNRIHGGWGRSHTTASDPELVLFQLRGYDAARGRGLYELALPQRNVLRDESRWQMQLSARYTF